MLQNKKRVFLEALLLTLLVFLLGMLVGVLFEEKRVDVIKEYYIQSEVSLMDIFALNNFANLKDVDCDNLRNSNVDFADRIYEEAKLLDRYEKSGRLTDDMNLQHKKYDVMRTFLWINTMKYNELCEEKRTHTIVYLYDYSTKDLSIKATNSVWSKILEDLKEKYGHDIILIPIAIDSNLVSLNSILENFEIEKYPALIVDNKYVIEELSSVEEIEEYFE